MTRTYLRWLRDTCDVNCEADKLIRNSDLPKIPMRLPRPLPPAIDIEIQNRLERSLCPHHHALLLMRKTGLRIGEVVSLSFDCLYIDSNKRAFLRVPLGKLHNERLVPLDDKTVKIIRKIQLATKKKAKHSKPSFLLRGRRRETLSVDMLRLRFGQVVGDLRKKDQDPINPHRFRHSYASELLNAGMSLESVMQLLGHRSIESTLRYAAVTQKNIIEEFQTARHKLHNTYGELTERFFNFDSPSPLSIDQSLNDAMTLLQNEQKELLPEDQRKTNRIIARLRRLKAEIQTLRRDTHGSGRDKNRYKKAS
jgi:site-specific recombinase XerD